jgi:hypothetical protein
MFGVEYLYVYLLQLLRRCPPRAAAATLSHAAVGGPSRLSTSTGLVASPTGGAILSR